MFVWNLHTLEYLLYVQNYVGTEFTVLLREIRDVLPRKLHQCAPTVVMTIEKSAYNRCDNNIIIRAGI